MEPNIRSMQGKSEHRLPVVITGYLPPHRPLFVHVYICAYKWSLEVIKSHFLHSSVQPLCIPSCSPTVPVVFVSAHLSTCRDVK